jgi:hypothetical protein
VSGAFNKDFLRAQAIKACPLGPTAGTQFGLVQFDTFKFGKVKIRAFNKRLKCQRYQYYEEDLP